MSNISVSAGVMMSFNCFNILFGNYLPFENARNGISTENPKEGTSETEQPHQTATTCVKEAKDSNSQGQNKKTTRSSRCYKTNDLILNLTPENVTQHSRIE